MDDEQVQTLDKISLKSLDGFFHPRSIAVIGASPKPEKIGHQILQNIVDGGFTGKVYGVHPSAKDILGCLTYPSIDDIPEEIDQAVIAVPARQVLEVFQSCVKKKVKCVSIISSGFAEIGNVEPQEKIKQLADEHGIGVLGPNMFGVVYAPSKLNASFGPKVSLTGNIAFISQSGAIGISLMGWAEMEHIGIGSLVSLGNKSDVDEKDLIEYFNKDPNIDVVLIYMEGLKNAREFLKTKIEKPVVVLKVGRSEHGAKAAASHTGSLVGSDKVVDAAFKQMGIMRAQTFTEAFGWSRSLSLPAPKGNNTLIITNGGGIGVRTSDECENYGIHLMEDTDWMEKTFRPFMPEFGSTKNPIDITGEAGLEGYRQTIRTALKEDKVDSLIVLYCETTVSTPLDVAKVVHEEYSKAQTKKPIVNVMLGGERTHEATNYLNHNSIPAFTAVNEAVSALGALYKWQEVKHRKVTAPSIEPPPEKVIQIIEEAKNAGRRHLLEHEAMEVMRLCGIQTPPMDFASNMDELIERSKKLFPLAMKIASPEILHKTDVDGVVLNVRNEEELLLKYYYMKKRIRKQKPDATIKGVTMAQMVKGIECIVGLSEDAQFGPTVMFGLGGVFVEMLKDVSFRIAPFGRDEAFRLIHEIKGASLLNGFRGYSANIPMIADTLLAIQRLSGLVKEVDINPLICNDNGCFAVDARIILN